MKPFLFGLALFAATLLNAQQKTEAWYVARAPFRMALPLQPKFATKTFSVRNYGAVPDGQTLNTAAFAKAIDACAKAGGGKVIVPAGLWLTGPIELRSGVNLVVERGALIQFTPDHTQYPLEKLGGSSSIQVRPPIYAFGARNVAITGEGVIDGAGDSWRPIKKDKVTASQWKAATATGVVSADGKVWWPSKEAMEGEEYLKTLKGKATLTAKDYEPARDFLRPHMVQLSNCSNVLVEGVTIRNSPKFVFYPGSCNNLTMRNVSIFNEWWAQNGDGIDISACKNVLIYKCTVSAGDDGICMKSSSSAGASAPRLENIVVAGCTVYHAHGGFVIGSNTDGGMNNIYVADCNFVGTDIGIRVKSNAGRGGLVHNVYIRDIYMSDIQGEAVLFDTYYEDVTAGKEAKDVKTTAQDKVPEFRDFFIRNVYCRGARTAVSITGLPQMPVQGIWFDSFLVSAGKAYSIKDATNIHFRNAHVLLPGGAVQDLAQTGEGPFTGLRMQPHSSINAAELARQYAAYPALWNKAIDFLRSQKLETLAAGKYPLAGDSVFVSVTYGPEKAFDSTKWEAHRKYIDVQYIIDGQEKMGVAPLASARELMPYNEAKDAANYSAEGSYYVADPSRFFIFFPQDVHRPNIKVAEGSVRKLVIKVLAAP
ncbi:YhcH/YjgK/YiaL family protein [Flaviaesturariibacter terrae]